MSFHHWVLFLHILGVAWWFGGLVFIWCCLLPELRTLSSVQYFPLIAAVLKRFFAVSWIAVMLVVFSGGAMLLKTGFAKAPPAWHTMTVTGLIMVGVFVETWFRPWRDLKSAVATENWARSAVVVQRLNHRVTLNLALGFVTIAFATLGLGM